MKLTLVAGGGVSGLTKEHSIELQTLDAETRAAFLQYLRDCPAAARPGNYSEVWIVNDEKEIPIDRNKLGPELQQLYLDMKNNLHYHKP